MIRPHIYDLYFDGKNLSDFGVHTSGEESFKAPGRDVEVVEVPGKDGDLLLDRGRFKNVEIVYPSFIGEDIETNFNALVAFLSSKKGYKRLEDTYHPDYFRLASYNDELDPNIILLQAGEFELNFYCKPQKYLKSGETTIEYVANGEIENATLYGAKPLIRVWGNGTVGISNYSFTVTENRNNYIDIDCEVMDCYRSIVNCNPFVTFTNHEFPVLEPGTSGISLGTGITKIEITPRWWTR